MLNHFSPYAYFQWAVTTALGRFEEFVVSMPQLSARAAKISLEMDKLFGM